MNKEEEMDFLMRTLVCFLKVAEETLDLNPCMNAEEYIDWKMKHFLRYLESYEKGLSYG